MAALSCASCGGIDAFALASGPPLCSSCLELVQKLLTEEEGDYICSSITRREDVLFATPPALQKALGNCVRDLSGVDEEPSVEGIDALMQKLSANNPGSLVIWAGAGLSACAGFTPDLSRNAKERSARDYERAFCDVHYSKLRNGPKTYGKLYELQKRVSSYPCPCFVVSSNVDGFFADLGLDEEVGRPGSSAALLEVDSLPTHTHTHSHT